MGEVLPKHGRDHRPGGADPIPGLSDGGDLVFLEEQIVVADGDTIVFDDIDQGYRHLLVHLMGATVDEVELAGDPANDPDDLRFRWNDEDDDYMWGQTWLWDGMQVENDTFEGSWVPIRQILPARNIGGAGDSTLSRAAVRVEFPYYATTEGDGFMGRNALWQAGSQVQRPGTTNPTGTYYSTSTGAANQTASTDPITKIEFQPAVFDWAAGSRASLYGIR